ncbi:thiamine-phosphate synthase family protein [Desulfitobacterium metallireducens]|uniref:AIR synthase n=1 Tax=Desulfitobacterium metallireducens DSM 15288 TaxID=871968 RepID=W0E9G4_9FIRM|nr:thiamine-phosphate synthase family protein [Desulfitobacterium metallireducens]AHF06153.1 AIR synthase [Desulfitobacterium metallireducens DSM 15288]
MNGKVNDDFFQKSVLPFTGESKSEVIIGPHMGVDAAILKIGDQYMAVAEDPIFPSMTMSADDFAYVTVHIGASDVAVMGIEPRFMTYSLLLPPETEESYVEELIKSISKYAHELGISIVGGHTGYYGAVVVPTIGGITVWGLADQYISPMGAQIGDDVLITKGAAIEAGALLGYEHKDFLSTVVDPLLVQKAAARIKEVSVVKDAHIAATVGGVHAMHDATEGGVKRGLWEIAQASGKGMLIDQDKIFVPEDIAALCQYLKLNPLEIISEGTLVLTCAPEKTAELRAAFMTQGIESAIVGKVTTPEEGCYILDEGNKYELIPPAIDKFWDVFFSSLSEAPTTLCTELETAVNKLCQENIYRMIPEIGANIAYASPESQSLDEVAGIPGRILRYKNTTTTLGQPELGGSVNMAETLLSIRKYFPLTRCLINMRNTPAILKACREGGLTVADMPTVAEYRQCDGDFIRDLEGMLQKFDRLPDVITIPDRINLEILILIPDETLDELIEKVLKVNTLLK